MKIQQKDEFECSPKTNKYYYLDNKFLPGIGYLSTFLALDFGCIGRNLEPNIQHYFIDGKGVGLPTTHVSIDKKII